MLNVQSMLVRPILIAATLAAAALFSSAAAAEDAAHGIAVVHHRFGESKYPATNTTLAQLDAQIDHLKAGGFTVWPLIRIVEAIQAGAPVPDKTIAITIDDAYASVFRHALPRLKAAGMTATLFVATESVDSNLAGYMDWDDVRQALDDGFDIGAHTVSHGHLADMALADASREINYANSRFTAELGFVPALFAYPFGEASLALRSIVKAAGYTAAFGQHSGVLHASEDPFYLPRFALNEKYGDIARFRTLAAARPLRAREITPRDMLLDAANNPPAFGFTVDASVGDLAALACYASGAGKLRLEQLGRRIEARLTRRLGPGRHRINCTLPAGGGRWRWFGRQFYVPPPAG